MPALGVLLVLLAGSGLYVYAQAYNKSRALPVADAVGEGFLTVENWFNNYLSVRPDDLEPLPELAGASVKALPRGIRNNNPGNIEYNGTPWRGLASPPSDGRFCIFTDARFGIRAMARILATYQSRGVDSLPEIISTWAPESENDTQGYILSVAARSGLSPVGMVSRDDWPQLIEAMIWHENGQQPYSMDTIETGVSWA